MADNNGENGDDILQFESDTVGEVSSIDTSQADAGDEGTLNDDNDNVLGEDDENADPHDFDDTTVDDPELEQIREKVRELEEEAEKLKKMHAEVDEEMNLSASSLPGASPVLSIEEKKEIDGRSIYVGNVDYGATAEELEQHFHGCGSINRVTINCDKYTGHPKGFAYIEFADSVSTQAAVALDESLFRGRQIKVVEKRTNIPGHSTTNRPPRGRGFRSRGRGFRGGFRPRPSYRGGYRPRRSSYYSPY